MARTQARDKDKTMAALKARIEALEHEVEELRNPIVRFEVGRDRRIIDANETLATLMGRPVSRLRGRRMNRVLSDYQHKPDVVFDRFVKGTPYPGPARPFLTIEIRDTDRFFQFAVRPKRDRRGTIRSLTFTGKDVTAELHQERRKHYRRTGEALHRVIDQMGLGIVHAYNSTGARFTASTRMGGVSNGVAVSLGFKVGRARSNYTYYRYKPELWQAPVTRLFPEKTIRKLNAALRANTYSHVDGEILERDGSTRPARLSILPYTGLWDNTVFTVLIEDRSEHAAVMQRLSRRLVESEEKYHNLFESASDPILLATPDFIITDANRRACEVYGYSRKELIGTDARILASEHTEEMLPELLKQLEAAGHVVAEATGRRRDGTIIHTEVSVSVIEVGGQSRILVICRDLTERRRAEAALRESEQRYRCLFESMPVGLFRTTADGRVLAVNQAIVRSLGYPDRETLLATRAIDSYSEPEKRTQWQDIVSRDGFVRDYELQVRRFDGTPIWFLYNARAVKDAEGKTLYYEGAVQDITERRSMEKALRASEARYRAIVEDQTEFICRFRPNGTMLFVNAACTRYVGKSPEELVGKSFFPFLPREDRRRVRAALSALTPQNPAVATEHRIQTAAGALRWHQWTNRGIFDDRGRLVEVQAVGRDITERKAAEEALRESEEKYRTLVEASPDAVFQHDRDGRYLYINSAGAGLYGLEPEDIVGKRFDELHPKAMADELLDEVGRVFRDERPIEHDSTFMTDRGRFHFLVVLAPIRDERDNVASVIGIARNVTEQRLLQEQLQRAARLASVGTLAAGVAHEINNPLAVISVDLPRLKRQYKDDPFVAKLCSKLLRMTKRISEITGGLLTFSKATAGAFDKHNLHGPLNGALDLMRSRFDYEHKRLVRRYASRLPAVWCDSDQLQQVFVNLCINALEAMPEQGKLTVSAKVDRRDRTVTLTFADTGKGIAADAIERAFDPFYTTKDTGTGLGLAVSHSIIEEHGGRIAIDGKPGKGTRVSVVLPVRRTQPAESERRAGRATKAGHGRPR